MKVLFLTNNIAVTQPLLDSLEKTDEPMVFEEKVTEEVVNELTPEFVISYNYVKIIKPEIFNLAPEKIVNLHISLLPWNKGIHPNIWSHLKNTPKGVTVHVVDKGIDTGDILLQKPVDFDASQHTVASSYALLHQELQSLFLDNWENLKSGKIAAVPQKGEGSEQKKKDFRKIEHLLGEEGWEISIDLLKVRYKQEFN